MKKFAWGSLALIFGGYLLVNAQDRKPPIKKDNQEYKIQLGDGKKDFEIIAKADFDSISKLPVYLKDENGNLYLSKAFELIFSEWGLFEDSLGREKVMVDYHTFSVVGSTIPEAFQTHIVSIAKPGDTLTIHNVWAEKIDASSANTIVQKTSIKKYIID